MVSAEVEASLCGLLPESPSCTAIQHLLARVGQCPEDLPEQLELTLQEAVPLDTEGNTLGVSWGGVIVPLRKPVPKCGRSPERPMDSVGTGAAVQTAP